MTDIGKTIAKRRKLLKLTQEELAEKSDITPHYLSKVERGVMKNVSSSVLYRLAKSLGVTMEALIDGTSEKHVLPEQIELDEIMNSLPKLKQRQYYKIFIDILKLHD